MIAGVLICALIVALAAYREWAREQKLDGEKPGAAEFVGIYIGKALTLAPFMAIGYVVVHLIAKYW